MDECRDITLRYSDQFTIQLGSSSGEIHNRSRFVYRLEGFSDNWVRTSVLNPNITFNSLSAGDYTLRVRMLNDEVDELFDFVPDTYRKTPVYVTIEE